MELVLKVAVPLLLHLDLLFGITELLCLCADKSWQTFGGLQWLHSFCNRLIKVAM